LPNFWFFFFFCLQIKIIVLTAQVSFNIEKQQLSGNDAKNLLS